MSKKVKQKSKQDKEIKKDTKPKFLFMLKPTHNFNPVNQSIENVNKSKMLFSVEKVKCIGNHKDDKFTFIVEKDNGDILIVDANNLYYEEENAVNASILINNTNIETMGRLIFQLNDEIIKIKNTLKNI